jgi:hypothetical protein
MGDPFSYVVSQLRIEEAKCDALRAELAAERARAERAEAAGVGYSQQTVDAITREREELRADRDRLRAAMICEKAKQYRAALEGKP